MVTFYTCVVFLFSLLVQDGELAAPRQNNLPISINAGEYEYINRKLHCLDVTDANEDTFSCLIDTQTSQVTDKFRVLQDPDTKEFCVYTHNSNPGTPGAPNYVFDYATNRSFEVFVNCIDQNNEASIGRLQVDVIAKERLEYNNLPASKSIDALNTGEDISIYTVQSTDLLNDQIITYYMRTFPSTNSFKLNAGTGEIRTALPLKHENNNPIDLFIKACDSLICIEEKLRIDLTNVNSVPTMTNLPAEVSVLETIQPEGLIYTITTTDNDNADILTYSLSVVPNEGTNLFQIDTTTTKSPQIKLAKGKKLNYEQTVRSYNITVSVTDTKATTEKYLIVKVLDDDEPCYFDKTFYIVSMKEGAAGSDPVNPGMVIKDYDGTSTYTLSLGSSPQSNDFTIDPSSGIINFKNAYNVDGGAKPSLVSLLVICTEQTQLTGTTTVTVVIKDINDNDPAFSLSSYPFKVNQNTAEGTVLGTLAVTDADSGVNGQVDCTSSTANTLQSTQYYTVGRDCVVRLITTNGLLDKQTVTNTVTATDRGTPSRSASAFIHLEYELLTTTTPTTTTTTPTTTTASPLTEPGTIAAIVVGSIIGAFLLGVLLYFLLRCCYTGMCCGPQPCDFTNCCSGNETSNYQNYTRRQITPQTDTKPRDDHRDRDRDNDRPHSRERDRDRDRGHSRDRQRDRDDDHRYRREDSDYDYNRSNNDRNHAPRSPGRRHYSPVPKAVTPSDVPMDVDLHGRRFLGYARP